MHKAALLRLATVGFLAVGAFSMNLALAQAESQDFYQPPTTLPAGEGTMIKSEPTPLLGQIPGIPGTWPGNGEKIMYTSTLVDGTPVATTGAAITPAFPWRGPGERPTVVVAPGTFGQGDQCAGSKNLAWAFNIQISPQLSLPVNYNVADAGLLLTAGFRVVMPDYIGLGTPGIHTYVNRVEQGNAVVDAARASNQLWNLPDSTPIAFWGYSQGGGASASAAEIVGERAPELNMLGTYAGAADPDLREVLRKADGSLLTGAIGYTLNSLMARYPELGPIFDKRLNEEGKQWLTTSATQCVPDTGLTSLGTRSTDYTVDGKSFSQILSEEPELAAVVDDQQIGRTTPSAPVYLHTSTNDDIVPADSVAALRDRWCALGAEVEYTQDDITPPLLPGSTLSHDFGTATGMPLAAKFLWDRINKAPVNSACSA